MLSFWGTLSLIFGAYAVFHILIIQGTKHMLKKLLPEEDPMTDTDRQIRDLIEMQDMHRADRRNRGKHSNLIKTTSHSFTKIRHYNIISSRT